jgi:hypothetical protein
MVSREDTGSESDRRWRIARLGLEALVAIQGSARMAEV